MEFLTVDAMMELIKKAHEKNSVVVKKLWAQRDFKTWLDPHILRIPFIKDFRHFRIFMEVRDVSVLIIQGLYIQGL